MENQCQENTAKHNGCDGKKKLFLNPLDCCKMHFPKPGKYSVINKSKINSPLDLYISFIWISTLKMCDVFSEKIKNHMPAKRITNNHSLLQLQQQT